MKRITLSVAALALLLLATETASAQTIRIVGGGGYYPSYGYRPYVPPVVVYPPVYAYPSPGLFYSTPIGNSGRLTIGYGNGWGGFSNYGYRPSFYGSPRGYGGWRR